MRTPIKILLATATFTALGALAPREAWAQLDVDPPLPNVLLLVDTSGSMEYLIPPDAQGHNQLPGSVAGTDCIAGTAPTQLNRWASLVTVLTGGIKNFSCQATPRDDTFKAEYSFLGVAPYDYQYYLPFHRLLSNGCTAGPGVLPTNYWDWPNGAIKYHDISSTITPCVTPWSQSTDGILDTFRDRVRFGLMTFDTFANPGLGVSGNLPDGPTGMKGMWSYYSKWTGGGTPSKGNPPGCAGSDFDVGARNQAAPPWEGRLIPFGPSDAPLASIQTTNDHIQEALVAMRPYGATPLAGMFDDANEFLLNDTSTDPSTGKAFGPSQDPFVQGGCRKTFVILLSDGEPNMDLMPECAQAGGNCPYKSADTTALALASLPGNNQIVTYVVGLGVSNPAALSGLGLTSCTQLDPAVHCVNPPAGLQACCQLTKIAAAGGTSHAYFADDLLSLKGLLNTVLAGISAGSTARTIPVFSGAAATAAQGAAGAAGYRFVGRFRADYSGHLWTGELERERYVCTMQNGALTPVLQTPLNTSGDDFDENLNTGAPTRNFFTFMAPPLAGGKVRSDWTIRPGVLTDDGLGTYGTATAGMLPLDGPSFATALAASPQALGIDPLLPPAVCSTTLKTASAATCVSELIRWEVGEVNAGLPDTRDVAACPIPGGCGELGSIYHSTPVIVGPPADTIRDDDYVNFSLQNAKRPLMLYTATTDGQLHAFKVASTDAADVAKVDTLQNNELWSFMPPMVLPSFLSSYNQQAILLDGAPAVADVVFERKRFQASTWRTVLVAGGGPAGGFYYALDITTPTKPQFLWQLATDTASNPLFGRTTPKPAITTVTVPDGGEFKEVAVAILPGGTAAQAGVAPCARDNTGKLMTGVTYAPRSQVKCWTPGPARTLTIVRLDTGEVLATFRNDLADGPPGLVVQGKVQTANFTSPITGVPVPYPSGTGQVSDRIYVGDADGALWRIDLSAGAPDKWKAKLAWDAYSITGDTDQMSEPVMTAPVIAQSPVGDTLIFFSTGEQDLLLPNAAMTTRLWSLKEKRNAVLGTFEVSANYVRQFAGGERVTGPMAPFAGVLYFSSFTPAGGGAACSYGGSAVWALDAQTGAAKFPDPAIPGTFKLNEPAPNTIIIGVAITQTPTCSDTSCASDAFFGTNCYVNGVQGGGYEVVWQKPQASSGVTGNNLVKTDADGTQRLLVQNPRQWTRIDSWAGIIE